MATLQFVRVAPKLPIEICGSTQWAMLGTRVVLKRRWASCLISSQSNS